MTVALACHVALLLAALWWSHSASGFLLNGPALAFLLDRYLLRALPWPAPVYRPRQTIALVLYFVVGTTVFYLLRPGIVPWSEAAYRGAMTAVIAFTLESLLAAMRRPHGSWRSELSLRLTFLVLLVVLIPWAAALHPLHTVPKRTPDALGLAFEDIHFRSTDGLMLAGWVVPHPQARGNVLFCHGHGRNRGHVAGLLPALHRLGLNVLAFDFRGHGDSEGHTSTFGHREVGDLLAAAAYVQTRFPGKPLFLVGVSLGAAVSLQALPLLPEVRAVWSEGAFAQLAVPIDNEFRLLPGWVRRPLVVGYHWLGWLDCGLWAPAVNPVDAVAGVKTPVYFCHGGKDSLVPPSEGQRLYAAHAGPKWHWWVANAGHYNVRQRNAQEYVRRLGAFIAAHLTENSLTPPAVQDVGLRGPCHDRPDRVQSVDLCPAVGGVFNSHNHGRQAVHGFGKNAMCGFH
jgi:alpha-beta hydrolase superfamily lysophospholipase